MGVILLIMFSVHNSLTGKVEEFKPIREGEALMYHCGPTVYGRQHIGNLSMFVFTDLLGRALEHEGFKIKPVINFTDFGHLTGDNEGDADAGEDKMTKGLKSEGLAPTLENMKALGKKYAEIFLHDIHTLNIRTKHVTFPYASDYIPAQIEMVKTLINKGFGYQTSRGIYFDTARFESYGKLGNVHLAGQREGARVETDSEKRNPSDFILWKKSEKIGWDSPWGKGFPGWHIECSTMIHEILGDQIDIHTGGVEHIGVHHQNEIAQSEAATGKSPFSRYWLHRAHLQMNNEKIAKSAGTALYLSDLHDKGFRPLAFRYLLLGSHYRTPANFTWGALEAAQNAYRKLKDYFSNLPTNSLFKRGKISLTYQNEFMEAIRNDLNTPEALAVVWKLIKDEAISPRDKRATLLDFDKILGLKLDENEFEIKIVPPEVKKLLAERERARNAKDFAMSDKLRDEIKKKGYLVEDSPSGPKISRA